MLGAVTAYTCPTTKTYCSPTSGAATAIFKQLQAQINRFAVRIGFAPIAVDGQIGNATVLAARKAIIYAIESLPDEALKANLIMFEAFTISRQALAPMADAIGSALADVATKLGLSATPPPVAAMPTTSAMPGQTDLYVLPATASFWAQRTTTEKAIMGIGAVSALGTLVILLLPKRKKKP